MGGLVGLPRDKNFPAGTLCRTRKQTHKTARLALMLR